MNDKTEETVHFHQMGLDDRILEAIARLAWKEPTAIQEKAIPYVLEGKDISAEARTGSGKTGAFTIPIIHKILEDKSAAFEQVIRALILAPSKELSRQIYNSIKQMTVSCRREIRYVDVSDQVPLEAQKPLLVDKPDIVIGTPMRVLAHLTAGNLDLKSSLQYLVIDEADLMFNFDHQNDIEAVLKELPRIYQSFITSATLNQDVKQLKKLVLHNPVRLKLEEPPLPTKSQLSQYVIKLEEFEKALLLYALLRLKMLSGKTIIFVNNVDKAYKLSLFLQQFEIATCVLNSEKPVASRCNIVEQFNKGVYEIIIASDELTVHDAEQVKREKKITKRKKDRESGVARGIDFQFVANIVNFDFPLNLQSYIHRVGRTARGNNSGTALSFVAVKEMEIFTEVSKNLGKVMSAGENVFQDFKFDFSQVDGFRYRAQDAWRQCTSILIMETRKNDLMQEICNATKLKSHFSDNPQDMMLLRHNKPNRGLKSQPHLRNVQDYMLSDNLRKVSKIVKKKRFNKKAPTRKLLRDQGKNPAIQGAGRKIFKARDKFMKKNADPLRSMQFSGFKGENTIV